MKPWSTLKHGDFHETVACFKISNLFYGFSSTADQISVPWQPNIGLWMLSRLRRLFLTDDRFNVEETDKFSYDDVDRL